MYECDLKAIVGLKMFKKCEEYIDTAKEIRHNKVLQQQVSKCERLMENNSAKKSSHSKQEHSGRYMYDQSSPLPGHSNNNQRKKWVINLSCTPLTPTPSIITEFVLFLRKFQSYIHIYGWTR